MASGGHFEHLIYIVQYFTIALHCWSIRFHTLYDISFKCWRDDDDAYSLSLRDV